MKTEVVRRTRQRSCRCKQCWGVMDKAHPQLITEVYWEVITTSGISAEFQTRAQARTFASLAGRDPGPSQPEVPEEFSIMTLAQPADASEPDRGSLWRDTQDAVDEFFGRIPAATTEPPTPSLAVELADGRGYGKIHRLGCRDLRDPEPVPPGSEPYEYLGWEEPAGPGDYAPCARPK